jgi:hypothetical protein
MHMRITMTLIGAASALALSAGAALAAGNGAIANQTTTSMGAPTGSPGYAAPRSEVVPGLPPQTREAQEDNEQGGRHVDQGATTPVQGPTNPVTGHTQVAR